MTDGAVAARAKQTGDEVDGIDDQLAAMEERLTAKSDRLRAQFAKMEAAMSASRSQGPPILCAAHVFGDGHRRVPRTAGSGT